jgi:TRAP-type mannitol/chloroaromatic compound transport system permease large subunit
MMGSAVSILFVLVGLSVPIAAVLGILALVLAWMYSPMPLHRALGDIYWTNSTDFILVAIPLFIMMGEILLRSGIAERMYGALSKWLSWLPGGLMHSNVGACTLFAATSGSSIATAATVGTVAIPQARKGGYNERLFLGTLAAGGTLAS